MRLMRFIRAEKAGLGKNRRPVEPLVPVGARPEVDPLVIPLAGIRMAPVVVNFSRWKQQNIARPADKLLALIIDNPFATDGEIEDITLHTQRPVDKKIQVSVRLNGG